MKKVLIISLVVLLVGLTGLTACGGGISETDKATIRGFGTRLDNLEAAVASLNSNLANLNTSTLQTDINQAKTDITAIKTDLEQLKTDDSEINTKLDSLADQIADLETRVKAVEDKLVDSSKADLVTCELITWGDVTVPVGATSLDTTFKVTVENTSANALEDIIFYLVVSPRPALSNPRNLSLSGGVMTWKLIESSSNYFVFENGWGFNMDANSTKKLMLNLHLEFDAVTRSTYFEAEIEIDTYDIK
jgi:prefoldin subunit 5